VTEDLSPEELVEAVELLVLVAEVCECAPRSLDEALVSFLGDGYGAADLAADALRLADSLAQAIGLADAQMELPR
jgi:class 3 adenylate cyclase